MEFVSALYNGMPTVAKVYACVAVFGMALLAARIVMLLAGLGLDVGDGAGHDAPGEDGGGLHLSMLSVAIVATVFGLSGLVWILEIRGGLLWSIPWATVIAAVVLYAVKVETVWLLQLEHKGAQNGADSVLGKKGRANFRVDPGMEGEVTVDAGGCPRQFRALNISADVVHNGDVVEVLSHVSQVLHIRKAQD